MPAILVILLVVVPIVELLIILQVGSALGAGWTVVLLVVASLIGAYLLRVEGARTWRQFRRALEEGRWPGDEVAEGALVLVGGALLLTPGFLTDVVGFLFLLAPTRRLVAGILHRALTPAGVGPVTGRWNARRRRAARRADGAREQTSSAPPLEIEVVEIERESQDPDGRGDAPDGDDGDDAPGWGERPLPG
jgi:UPF0716 protein FxsA